MLETFSYEQLDPATKAYLRDVRAGNGAGAPGMFYAVPSYRPAWALVAGVFVLAFFLWIASTSTKAPWAVAMLQTAAILMGGWLILYAFRRWLANPDKFAGWFYYFDPAHAYIGEGETIRVAALPADTEIAPSGPQSVQFMTQHDGFTVALPNRVAAAFVADYYAAVDWVMGRETGPWAGLPLAEVGGVARYLVEEDSEPPSVQDTGLRIDALPEEVKAVRRPRSGALGYLAVVGVGAVLFGLFTTANPGMQDDRAWDAAKAKVASHDDPDTTGAQGLRDYLLNERHTKHRDEATAMLAGLYDKPVAAVKASATDPELKKGMVALLESLRGPDTPSLSIDVADKAAGSAPDGPMAAGLRTMIADGIGKAVGKDMVVFVKKPDDKRAFIEVKYQVAGNGAVEWWAEVRLSPDDEKPYAVGKGRVTYARPGLPGQFPNIGGLGQPKPQEDPTLPSAASNEVTEAVYRDLMTKMVGSAPPKAVVPVETDF